jgi:hypothetical protein
MDEIQNPGPPRAAPPPMVCILSPTKTKVTNTSHPIPHTLKNIGDHIQLCYSHLNL